MKALFDSIVRTLVPIIVGAVIGWAVTTGIVLDDQFEVALTLVITAAFQGVYYVAVRLLELYVAPRFGWLLGIARQPVYVPDPATATRSEYQDAIDPHTNRYRSPGAHNQ